MRTRLIEMVGRLIQQDHISLATQRYAESKLLELAAAKCVAARVKPRLQTFRQYQGCQSRNTQIVVY